MGAESVVVLGVDTPIGLTVVRELGSRGVAVHGIAGDRQGVGLYSRYLRRGYIRPATDDQTTALLNDLAASQGAHVLMAISESDIAFINRNAERLGRFKRLVPDAQRMALVVDKMAACEAARKVGIEVPNTREVGKWEEIERVATQMRYPVILKWRCSGTVAPLLSRAGLPLTKAQYCYDPDGLRAALSRYACVGVFPLVQAYCPGIGLGHTVFMHRGEPLLRFQHRRLHEWPPEGGVSTVCQSLGLDAHQALFEKSLALLRSIGWEGAAMVEYRYDPATDRAVFMEINGRFWGSLPLAYHAGAHFAWYTYSVLGRGVLPEPTLYPVGVTCRFMVPETRRLLTILFRASRIQDRQLRFHKATEIWAFFSGFVRPHNCYYVFSWRDPLPCIADLAFVLRKMIRTVLMSPLRLAA